MLRRISSHPAALRSSGKGHSMTDAETIAELRRLLAESERQRQVLSMRFAALAWEAGCDPTVVRIARADEAGE